MNSSQAFDTLAHRLLDDLEVRHDQLLDELDALNARVDAVLAQYVTVRPDQPPSAELVESESNDDDEE